MSAPLFTSAKINQLLGELTQLLQNQGYRPQIYVVGGAAMTVHYSSKYNMRQTNDIDAVYLNPNPAIEQAVAQLAQRHGLPRNWFNNHAVPFLPQVLQHRRSHQAFGFATADELIAMKLAASRAQDFKDLAIIADDLGITSARELVKRADAVWEENAMQYDVADRLENLRVAVDVLRTPIKRRGETQAHSAVQRSGRCALCGRRLGPKSTDTIGPTCARKLYPHG